MAKPRRISLRHRAQDMVAGALLEGLRPLPYRWRIPLLGWLGAHLVGPVAGLRKRVRRNLDLVAPDLPPAETRAAGPACARQHGPHHGRNLFGPRIRCPCGPVADRRHWA